MKYTVVLILVVVITTILIATYAILNNKYYVGQLDTKGSLMKFAHKLASGGSLSTQKYTWFALVPKKDNTLEIKSTNAASKDIYRSLLQEESKRILKRAGTGGGFLHLNFRHKDDVSHVDTLAYTVSYRNSSHIALVVNMHS